MRIPSLRSYAENNLTAGNNPLSESWLPQNLAEDSGRNEYQQFSLVLCFGVFLE